MCFMLYLASDGELLTTVWNKKNPCVAVGKPRRVPKHFSKRNVHYVASSEECGCGFKQEDDVKCPDLSQSESIEKIKK